MSMATCPKHGPYVADTSTDFGETWCPECGSKGMGSLPDERRLSASRLGALRDYYLAQLDGQGDYEDIFGHIAWLEATIEQQRREIENALANYKDEIRRHAETMDLWRESSATIERQRPVIDAAQWAVEASDLMIDNYDVSEPAAADFRNAADEAWQELRKAVAALSEG